jgi:WD40 repeat protein
MFFRFALGLLLGCFAATPCRPATIREKPAPRTDCYGDPLPEGALARLGTIRFRHASQVRSAAYSPDGRLLATGGYDDEIHLWQASSGKELFRFALPAGEQPHAASVVFSPDGALLAGCNSCEHGIHVWETSTGKERRQLKIAGGASATSLTFSGDGSLLAAICCVNKGRESETHIGVWRVSSDKEVELSAPAGRIWSIAFSHDGKSLAVGQEGEVYVCDAVTGRKLRTLCRGDSHFVVVAFSADGVIASAMQSERVVRLWDAATGRAGHVLSGHKDWITSLAFSADGKRLVSASLSDSSFRVWDIATGKLVRFHQGVPAAGCGCLALSPDGKTVAEGSINFINALRLWDVATDKEIVPAGGHLFTIGFVSFLPGGKVVSSGAGAYMDTGVRIWEARGW